MLIWLIALVLIGGLAAAGRSVGAVRYAVMLVGVIVAKIVAFKFGPLLSDKMSGMEAFTNPAMRLIVPPIILFAVVLVIFSIIQQVVHQYVALHYRYKVSDEKRVMWERMNDGVGIPMGGATGFAAFVAFLSLVQVAGYPATQWEGGASNPAPVRLAGSLYRSMEGSGFARLAEAATPMSDDYYLLADIFGLIYNNPTAAQRLTTYPETMVLSESDTWQAVANDSIVEEVMGSQGNVMMFMEASSVLAIMNNPTSMSQIMSVDFEDLYEYLQSGESPKYQDEKLLGRWYLSIKASTVGVGQKIRDRLENVNMLRAISWALGQETKDLELIAGANGEVLLKGSLSSVEDLRNIVTGNNLTPILTRLQQRAQQQAGQQGGGNPQAFEDPYQDPENQGGESGAKVVLRGTWTSKGNKPGGAAYEFVWEDKANDKDPGLIDPLKNLRLEFGGGMLIFYPAQGRTQ